MTILIADSGSTKTDWTLVDSGLTPNPSPKGEGNFTRHLEYHTQGINPVHQSEDTIRGILASITHHPSPDTIFFYGAGCTEAQIPTVRRLLSETFQTSGIEVNSDLLGAARALCGRDAGIACILGTGANSCLYDGERIVRNTPALGYILGDEGSGAVLGRLFVNALYKGLLPATLRDTFEHDTHLDAATIINKVYREPMANRFLASLSTFIGQHLDCEPLRQLVIQNFRQFFRHNLAAYHAAHLPVGAVGSIAWHYRDLLAEAAAAEGFRLGTVVQSPMQGLITYHCSH